MKFNEILDNIEEIKKKLNDLKEESKDYIQRRFKGDYLQYMVDDISEKFDKYIDNDNTRIWFSIASSPRYIETTYNTYNGRQLRPSPYIDYGDDDNVVFYSIIESISDNCDLMAESFKIIQDMPVPRGEIEYTREGLILTFTEDKGDFDIVNKYKVYWSKGKTRIDLSIILKIYKGGLELESKLDDGISVKTNVTVMNDYRMYTNEPAIEEEYTISEEGVERNYICNVMLDLYKRLKPVVERESVVLDIIGRGVDNGLL